MLSWEQQRAVEREAPTHWVAPSGGKHRIDYRLDSGPTVALRLQEAFGTAETPCIAGGAVPLTFELLTPAQRPAQVTQDLTGFWKSSYQQARTVRSIALRLQECRRRLSSGAWRVAHNMVWWLKRGDACRSQVRRELKGRYPKHAWPDDPTAVEHVKTRSGGRAV